MKDYTPSELRNIALLGHQGVGKTSLTESILKKANVSDKKGSVEDGNTVSDYTKEEKRVKNSIYATVIPVEYNNIKYNFIDTPGFFDYGGEVNCALRAARSAVLVIDAVKGVEVGTVKNWKYLRSRCLPSIIFVNKMDKENIKFDEVINNIREHLDKRAVPFCWPIGHGNAFEGFVNVVEMKARLYNGVECVDAEIWPERKDQVQSLHNMILESVANIDDEIMMKYLEGEEISHEEVVTTLRKGILKGQLVPVLVGSALKDVGVNTLLNTIKDYLPSEADLKTPFGEALDEVEIIERKVDVNEPFSAYVFKTVVDPFVGKISFVDVKSGKLSKDQVVLNVNKEKEERINNISFIRGKEMIETSTISAGDIGVVIKVDSLETGDTICDPKNPIKYEEMEKLSPTIYYSLVVKNKNDEGKIADALRKIASEDMAVSVERNSEVKQLIVGCQGQSHIDVIVDKLKSIYNIDVTLEDAKISYRETIKGKADVEGRFVKQSGGSGQYGIVQMRFEPCDSDSEFVNEVFGGHVPTNYIPAVQKGFEESLKQGVLAGFPVIGVKATVYDGKYHPVDSSELAFKMAASIAFKDGCKKAHPVLLEPIMQIKVITPNEYVGDIMGDLSKRRGIIEGIEVVGDEQYITAEVPQVELQKYIIDLKTMTQAQATFTMKFVRYDEVPTHLATKIFEENKKD